MIFQAKTQAKMFPIELGPRRRKECEDAGLPGGVGAICGIAIHRDLQELRRGRCRGRTSFYATYEDWTVHEQCLHE